MAVTSLTQVHIYTAIAATKHDELTKGSNKLAKHTVIISTKIGNPYALVTL
jgi:hypothetical protein